MKRGTASRVILGKNTIAEMPGGVFVGTDVILGKKDGLTNDFNGLVLSNTVMLGKKVSHAAIISVIVRGADRIVLPDAIANSLSYVKAFGGTKQGLPGNYTQVNYVTNPAQTYVNTGVMIDFSKNYEIELECRAVAGSWYVFQSRADATAPISGFTGASSGNTIILGIGGGAVCTSAITRTAGNQLYIKATMNAGTATLYVKDETTGTEDTQTGSYDTTQSNPTVPLGLLGNVAGQYVGINSDIYMARIKENGVTILDYVPARQNEVAGFYDRATGEFKTAETQANLTASINSLPTPDAPMDIVSNNGVLKARYKNGLPLRYQQVEWLSSTLGINIPEFKTKDTQSFNARFVRYGSASQYLYYSDTSASGTTNTTAYIAPSANWRFDGVAQQLTVSVNTSLVHNTIQNKNGVWVDGEQVATYTNVGSFTSTRDMTLLSTASTQPLRFYSLQVEESGVKVLDLIPVQDLVDNTYGVYDLVGGQFYTNEDATITVGNPIDDIEVEVYADGDVETIKDSLNNTATAEMLLKVGDSQDQQEIINGAVTRKVGVLVLDGTENWYFSSANRTIYANVVTSGIPAASRAGYCSHFTLGSGQVIADMSSNEFIYNINAGSTNGNLSLKSNSLFTNLANAKQWLADQYTAGTPVIVVYPLATATTESVTGQTLQVTAGDNVLEITQASLSGLELEAQYNTLIELTVQEVESANLDNDVTVTIL